MRARARRARASTAGFTLIETLIVTAMMAAIVMAIATVTAQWLPNWNRGFARVQQSDLLALGLERIIADLSAAQFIPPNRAAKDPLFEGSELSVTFVRSAIGPNTSRGLEVIRLVEINDAGVLTLVRSRMPFVPLPRDAPFGSYLRFQDPLVLLRAPYRIMFAYAGPERAWQNTWANAPVLPRAVRITVRDAQTQQTLAASTTALVHVDAAAECVLAQPPPYCDSSAAPSR